MNTNSEIELDPRLQPLIDKMIEKFNLKDYHLATLEIYHEKNIFNDTEYRLVIEWFPPGITERVEEDCNPDGTICLDIDLPSTQLLAYRVVGDSKQFPYKPFEAGNKDSIIQWVEEETRLTYMKHFTTQAQEDPSSYEFKGCFHGIPLSPTEMISIQLNEQGELKSYYTSIRKEWIEDHVKQEEYTLALNHDILEIANKQWTLIEFPDRQGERWLQLYALEEIYVTNDQSRTISFEPIADKRSYLNLDRVIEWEQDADPSQEQRITEKDQEKRRPIQVGIRKISYEQVLAEEPHPDTLPITEEDQNKIIVTINQFLRDKYPLDSGKWKITYVFRSGDLNVVLKPADQGIRVILQPKIIVFLDPKTWQVTNYLDMSQWNCLTKNLKDSANIINISRKEAFELIKDTIKITPYYVYDFDVKKYVLCGKIDTDYAVVAETGEVINLSEL